MFDHAESERMRAKYQHHFSEAEDVRLAHCSADRSIRGTSTANVTATDKIVGLVRENSPPAEETSQFDE